MTREWPARENESTDAPLATTNFSPVNPSKSPLGCSTSRVENGGLDLIMDAMQRFRILRSIRSLDEVERTSNQRARVFRSQASKWCAPGVSIDFLALK